LPAPGRRRTNLVEAGAQRPVVSEIAFGRAVNGTRPKRSLGMGAWARRISRDGAGSRSRSQKPIFRWLKVWRCAKRAAGNCSGNGSPLLGLARGLLGSKNWAGPPREGGKRGGFLAPRASDASRGFQGCTWRAHCRGKTVPFAAGHEGARAFSIPAGPFPPGKGLKIRAKRKSADVDRRAAAAAQHHIRMAAIIRVGTLQKCKQGGDSPVHNRVVRPRHSMAMPMCKQAMWEVFEHPEPRTVSSSTCLAHKFVVGRRRRICKCDLRIASFRQIRAITGHLARSTTPRAVGRDYVLWPGPGVLRAILAAGSSGLNLAGHEP